MATTTYAPETTPTRSDAANRWLARAYILNWETAVYIAIFVLAVFTRFYNLGARVMSHDESLHTTYSYHLYAEGNYQHTPLMHGPILFHMTALSYFLFGDNDFTARIYPAVLGVIITVIFPILFRRWLGKTGAMLTSIMLLISPLLMYYNRYIREDTPAIFFNLLMAYAIFMYLDGPEKLRRKARWLYLLAGAMLGSLGSKETAFMVIGIFGLLLTLYCVVRMVQYFWKTPGKVAFYLLVIAILIGGVAALAMYVILSIATPNSLASGANNLAVSMFVDFTLLVVGLLAVAVIGTALWSFRNSRARIRAFEVILIGVVAVIVCLSFIQFERVSLSVPDPNQQPSVPAEPGQESAAAATGFSMAPVVATWIVSIVAILALVVSWMSGWWRKLHRFPELDIMMLMGTLVLPWMTPLVIYAAHASPTDYSPLGIQRAAMVVIPLGLVSLVAGLVWSWKRWLISAAIFYVLFVFFFTTMFTNPNGLATGMIGSLGYWLEQQGVRRGNQPQYYYLLIIMPFYEFFPVIGSVAAMIAGLAAFWRVRKARLEEQLEASKIGWMNEATGDGGYEKPKHDDLSLALDEPTPDDAPPEEQTAELGELLGASPPDDPYRPRNPFENPSPWPEQTYAPMRGDGEGANSEYYPDAGPQTAMWPSSSPDAQLKRLPFILFIAWWGVFNLIAFTLAGEKMPWLGTHMTVPLILLSGWFFGGVLEKIDLQKFRQRGWLYLLLLPLLFVVLFQVAEPFLVGDSPFAGLQQQQLQKLYQWLAVVAVSGLVLMMIYRVIEATGWKHFRQMFGAAAFLGLGLITFRSAWMASFINYDYPTEFLVYAHGGTGNKITYNMLQDLSIRMTGGMDLHFAYDDKNSWPGSWYFRHFPNAHFIGGNPTPQNLADADVVVVGDANRSRVEGILADNYYHFEFMRMWWPMQDYFGLTPERIANTFDLSTDNSQAGGIRRGMFDIWWSRDYSAYNDALGTHYTLTEWPVRDLMHVYVRKDIASQIWSLGVGGGEAANTANTTQTNQCVANWQPRAADAVFTGGQTPFNHPVGIAVSPTSGWVYVTDEFNNRVAVFDPNGNFLFNIADAAHPFNRPNGVAIGPSGNIYVADTWNYQVKVFSPTGQFITGWGEAGQFGLGAQQAPTDAFWGPRAIAVDSQEHVYVADTGNKRVRVYTANGDFVTDIGTGGSGPGQLDEPTGLSVADNKLYVADTWNQRISVFSVQGAPLYQFSVRGWYEDQGNRPYDALDLSRNLLYVTDPDSARILIYDTTGNCVGSFGQTATDNPDPTQLKVASGVATDASGNVYVVDSGAGRILKFSAYPIPVQSVPAQGNAPQGAGAESTLEIGPRQSPAESTAEVTAERTQPVGSSNHTTAESTPAG